MNKKVRVRFAPSPTGFLHLGGIRTALYNYLFAKKHGGDFILRIEDTDMTRFVPEAEKYIIDSLSWLGITPDEGPGIGGNYGPYKQSERLHLYKNYALALVESGHAYYAFDSNDELDKLRKAFEGTKRMFSYNSFSRRTLKNSVSMSSDDVKAKLDAGDPYVIRFKMPKDVEISFNDSVRGMVVFNTDKLDDKVLFKSDGYPSYHLANVVDDHLMEISHVIRAVEWLPSAPLHVLLYDALGWDKPEFCHLPLVNGPDGKKLSKRNVDVYNFPIFPLSLDYTSNGSPAHIDGLKEFGFDPHPLLNFLALIGWNPGGEQEFFSMDELVDLFSLEKVNNSSAMFNIEKAKSFNAHYMRNRNSEDLFIEYILPNVWKNSYEYSEVNIRKIIDIAKERAEFAKDLYGNVKYFFEPIVLADDVALKNPYEFLAVMDAMLKSDLTEKDWTEDFIKADLDALCETLGHKPGKVLADLRMAITGGAHGSGLPLTMEILGKEESIKRIKSLINNNRVVG